MIKKYILTENDIEKIIAEHFKLATHDVNLYIKSRTVGYGTNEHEQSEIICEVEDYTGAEKAKEFILCNKVDGSSYPRCIHLRDKKYCTAVTPCINK